MSDYQGRIRLTLQGLDRIAALDDYLGSIEQRAEGVRQAIAGIGQALQSNTLSRGRALRGLMDTRAERLSAAQSVINTRQRRDTRGRFIPGPNLNARRLAGARLQAARIDSQNAQLELGIVIQEGRRLRERQRRLNERTLPAYQSRAFRGRERREEILGVATNNARAANQQIRLGSFRAQFQRRLENFSRGGGGTNAPRLIEEVFKITQAWAAQEKIISATGDLSAKVTRQQAAELSTLSASLGRVNEAQLERNRLERSRVERASQARRLGDRLRPFEIASGTARDPRTRELLFPNVTRPPFPRRNVERARQLVNRAVVAAESGDQELFRLASFQAQQKIKALEAGLKAGLKGAARSPLQGTSKQVGSPAYFDRLARQGGAAEPLRGRPNLEGSPLYLERMARLGGASSPVTGARRGLPPIPGSPAARSLQFTADARSLNRQSNWQAALQQLSETAETIRAGQAKVRQSWQTAFAQADDIRSALQGAASSRRVNVKSGWQKALMQLQEVDSQLRGVESGSQVNVKSSWQKALGQMEAIRDDLRGVQTTRQSVIKKSWQTALGEMQGIGNELRLATKSNRTRIVASWQKALTEGQQIAEDMRNPRRGRPTGLFQGNLRDAIGEGLIGGAFPLLFGQGLGASAGGLAGGFGGGLMGGTFGFGLSLAGTALGSAVDRTVQGLQTLAGALKSPTDTMAALEASGFRVSDSLKNNVEVLQSVGRAYDAQTLVLQEVERRLGAGSVQGLVALNQEQRALQEQWSAMAATAQGELLPVLIGATNAFSQIAAVANVIVGIAANPIVQRINTILSQATPFGGVFNAIGAAAESGREITRNAPARPGQTPQEIFAAETARINRARELEDMQRDIQRGELDLLRRKQDIEFSIADQRRAESDYEKEVADYRWSVEQRVFQLRAEAIRAQSEVMQAESDVRVGRIGLEFDQRTFDARPGLEQDFLEASRSLLEVQEQTETKIARDKIETELRIEDLKRQQIDRERQLEREKEQLEQRKDQLLRGRIQLERGIADYQIQVADYQRETARKIFDAWRQMNQEMQAAGNLSGGSQFSGAAGPLGGSRLSRLIGNTESYGGNYGAFNRGGSAGGHRAHGSGIDPNLVNMTISEIQRRQLAPGAPSSQHLHAVGKYQIIGSTLRALMQGRYGPTGVSMNDRFTPEVQERLGAALARNRVQGRSVEEGMRGLRQEWIGLQYVNDAQLREAVIELQRPGAVSTAMQGPNTRPDIPLNQAAVLNGQPVIWNGRNWEKATVPGATTQQAMTAPVNLQAPARPTAPNLPGAPDTSAMQRGMAQSTEQITESQRRLLELSKELADIDRQRATNALMRVAQGPNRVREAEDRLRAERYLASAVGAVTEREQEKLELIAGQNAEYEQLAASVEGLKAINVELNQRGALSNENLVKANALLDDQLAKQAEANQLDQEALDLQQRRNALLQTQSVLRQAAATGAGLRAGLIGPEAQALERGLIAGLDAEELQRDVAAARVLQDQQLIWDNLAEDITNVSDAIAGGLTQGLADIVTGARSIKDVGREVLDSIANTFLDSAQQQLSVMLQRSFASVLGGEGGLLSKFDVNVDPKIAVEQAHTSAMMAHTQALLTAAAANGIAPTGGLLGGLASQATTTIFQGGASAAGSVFSAAAPNLLGSFFGGASPLPLNFLAEGGPVSPNQPYIVGDGGEPELFIPGVSGKVVPMSDLKKAQRLQQMGSDDGPDGEINVRYEAKEIAGERYVTEAQFRKGMARAAQQGKAMAYSGMRNSGSTRRSLGV